MDMDAAREVLRSFAKDGTPEYEDGYGLLNCNYCPGDDDGQEWQHTDDCPWIKANKLIDEEVR